MDIPSQWTFQNQAVAREFDQHVRGQLPWYDMATRAVVHICRHYIPEHGGMVYDLGCATGNIARSLAPLLDARGTQMVSIDASQEMVDRFDGPGVVRRGRLEEMRFDPFDVGILFLTLMFVPPAARSGVLSRLRSQCRPGGAVLLVERVEPHPGYVSTVLARLTLSEKLQAGVPGEEVLRKELSLAGIQRPLAMQELPRDAREWFRFGDFVGWILEAPR